MTGRRGVAGGGQGQGRERGGEATGGARTAGEDRGAFASRLSAFRTQTTRPRRSAVGLRASGTRTRSAAEADGFQSGGAARARRVSLGREPPEHLRVCVGATRTAFYSRKNGKPPGRALSGKRLNVSPVHAAVV